MKPVSLTQLGGAPPCSAVRWLQQGVAVTSWQRTDLINLSPRLEVVAVIMAAQQLQSLGHMIPGILDLIDD